MNNKPAYLSREGLAKLREELDELVNVRRAEVANRIHEAKEHGDVTENAEYEDAKNEQAFVEGRIQTLSALIKNAVIIDEKHSTTHVQIGSTVELEGDDGREKYTIVGLGRGGAARGPHLQRVAGRPFAARQEEGRQGDRLRPGGRLGLQDRRHQLTRPDMAARPQAEDRALFWADELAASVEGPQVVNDSKTPSGTVHVGSLRGVVLHDAIRRAVAERGLDVTFRYGVEDLDPMDAQSLLTPDAVESAMGRPLAHVPAPAGSDAPNYARHFAGLFLKTFEGLGIRPELYWMSEQYASGAMDPYIEKALDRASVILEIYRTVSTVNHPPDWLPVHVICENCGRIGTTIATGWDGQEVAYECRAGPRRVGHRLRPPRQGFAVRRPRQAGLERGLGRALGPGRRHHRGLRQGPGHGRRLARPCRRDQPPGLRPGAAAQRALRVPEHRRQEDEHVQGDGRGRPRDRGHPAARSCCASSSSARSRAAPSSSTRRATRSPASSTSSTASAPRSPAARTAASCRRPRADPAPQPGGRRTPIRPWRPRATGRRSATWRC